jgi:ribosomal protein L11 methyltransferase
MSFGTGEHFTTRFCLESIDRLCDGPRPPASLLDIGTGSGILALAAAKLGVRRVWATDNDALALVSARENAALNRLSKRVLFSVGDIAADPLPGPADAVCANLFSGLLMSSSAPIVRASRRWIVLSGIREFEADGVADAFRHAGALERVRDGDGEWCGLLLEKESGGMPNADRRSMSLRSRT